MRDGGAMTNYWERAEWLDPEVQSLMSNSELTVFYDEPHSCIHIMRGDEEFSSALYPMDDSVRNELRQQAYLLNNGMNEDEVRRIAEANEKREAYGEKLKKEADAEFMDFGVFEYKNRFISPQVTPMVISPGVNK
jgi:hypothetical protein